MLHKNMDDLMEYEAVVKVMKERDIENKVDEYLIKLMYEGKECIDYMVIKSDSNLMALLEAQRAFEAKFNFHVVDTGMMIGENTKVRDMYVLCGEEELYYSVEIHEGKMANSFKQKVKENRNRHLFKFRQNLLQQKTKHFANKRVN